MKQRWVTIYSLWAATIVAALITLSVVHGESAFAWFGAIVAGSVATVSLIHLIKASPSGFVTELIYVGGGSYLILALFSIYLFARG